MIFFSGFLGGKKNRLPLYFRSSRFENVALNFGKINLQQQLL
ncbi:hypothetical protein wcw_1679 [Waddlia chondrophila WSU 86-1044]|uniref:Uncharacterized protein n=1 Tax=Waddlia chondrophila (strain ATCC VR-1470 / WSU 86-1044) TaxID=716544 RepID=D6YSH8_WADCW|nr:hypothetical protein wcw_1679 [Waddlia chondrophila WSU 86-1044]